MAKRSRLVLIIVVIVLCIVCAVSILIFKSNYIRTLKLNWGIELPKAGAEEIFSFSEASPHGDGIRYHVIDYPVGDESKRIQNTTFQLEKIFSQSEKASEDQISYVNELISKINVKDDVIPDWGKCDLIYQRQEDNSELFLFYWSGTGTVFILESFL